MVIWFYLRSRNLGGRAKCSPKLFTAFLTGYFTTTKQKQKRKLSSFECGECDACGSDLATVTSLRTNDSTCEVGVVREENGL